jgi:hypothetical protein
LRTIRLFVSGSAPLLAETHSAFHARTGHKILERYGMTETGMLTSNPLEGDRIAGTVGPPLPGVSVRVVDAERGPCGTGQVGCIEVRGPNVFNGYWRMPEKTREDFTDDGFFRTGDMGEMLPNGYLRIVGRAKDVIITGGLNVYPKEIEEKIDALPGVTESAVIGVPDADFGEAVAAIVVAKDGHALTEADVIAALKGEIASFKVPKRVHFVSELPRNAMGKVQKNVLREAFAKPCSASTEPRSGQPSTACRRRARTERSRTPASALHRPAMRRTRSERCGHHAGGNDDKQRRHVDVASVCGGNPSPEARNDESGGRRRGNRASRSRPTSRRNCAWDVARRHERNRHERAAAPTMLAMTLMTAPTAMRPTRPGRRCVGFGCRSSQMLVAAAVTNTPKNPESTAVDMVPMINGPSSEPTMRPGTSPATTGQRIA